jgi:uncharacterized protein (DUF305 family)
MKHWRNRWGQLGFDAMVREFKDWHDMLPLSDILHLAKNFRTRFLKCMLTFHDDCVWQTIDQGTVAAILD